MTLIAVSDNDWNVKVNGRVTLDQDRIEGAVVSLLKNSRLMQEVVTSGNGKFVFVLRPGNDYIIEVAKPGYVRKSISFSTKNVPNDKVGKGFPDFPIEFILFEELAGVNTDILNNPIGRIIYSPSSDDFTIDLDYYNTIKRDLAKLNREMLIAQARMKRAPVMEQEERVDIIARNYTTPIGVSDNSIIPEIVVEANNHVREESVQWSDRLGVDIKTGIGLLEYERARIRKELEHLPAALVSINTYKDGDKEILIRIVFREQLFTEYKRVTQPWGSKFYFRDSTIITQHLFQLESDLEALLESKTFKF